MASWGLWLPLDREPCFPDRKAGPRRPVWPANPCDMTWGTPGAEAAATRAARPVDRDGTSSITCTCVARRQSEEARRRSIGVRPLPGPGEKQQDVPRVQPLPRLDRSLPPEPKLVPARHEAPELVPETARPGRPPQAPREMESPRATLELSTQEGSSAWDSLRWEEPPAGLAANHSAWLGQ